jgi:hypothetical protein
MAAWRCPENTAICGKRERYYAVFRAKKRRAMTKA